MMEEDDGSTCKNEAVVPPRWSHGGSGKPQKIVFQRLQRRPHFSQPTSQLLLDGGLVLQQQAPDLEGATELKWQHHSWRGNVLMKD